MNIELSKDAALAAVFKALGDPTRLRIFEFLRCCDREVEINEAGQCRPAGSLSVGEVCCRLDQSMSTASHHLKELRLAGLIRTEKRGRWIYCSVNPGALDAVRQFLDQPVTGCASLVPTAVTGGREAIAGVTCLHAAGRRPEGPGA